MNDVHGDYPNFLYYDGRSYVLVKELPAVVDLDVLGRKLGTVECQLHMHDTEGYQLGSGDASFLDPGTPFFERKGQPTEQQLVARYDHGCLAIYDVDAKRRL